jgi:hypothetical protein
MHGVVSVTNAGDGRVTASISATHFGDGANCNPADINITPTNMRLLPGHEEQLRVQYTGTVGCVSAVGITVGMTEVVIPILIGDDSSGPALVQVVPTGPYEVTFEVMVLGNAPVQATLSMVQRDVQGAARLPNLPMVLLPNECTRVALDLALPLTPATHLEGVISWNGVEQDFVEQLSARSLDDHSACEAIGVAGP